MIPSSRIYIAGHRGSRRLRHARELSAQGFSNLLFKTQNELELTDQQSVDKFFAAEQPEYVFLAAAKVGGILANHLSGPISSVTTWQSNSTLSRIPTNLYDPCDNFDLNTSHVLPALIRKFHEAKSTGQLEVSLWGTGTPLREFLHVDDLASACVFLMQNYSAREIINVGVGEDISIRGLTQIVARVIGYTGKICSIPPNPMASQLLDVSRLRAMGWCHRISLEDGIRATYDWYLGQPSVSGNLNRIIQMRPTTSSSLSANATRTAACH